MIIHGDAVELPIRSRSVDLVLTSPMSDPDVEAGRPGLMSAFLSEIGRVIKPDGRIFVFGHTPNEYWPGDPYPGYAFDKSFVIGWILTHSAIGEVVLDPFCGTGIVPKWANLLQRRGIGVELNREVISCRRY